MTNPIATLAALLALTIPQRRVLGAHLIAFAQGVWTQANPPITETQAREIATHLSVGLTDRDMAVLEAAVWASPARGLISSRDLRTLERAWTALGWDFGGSGIDFDWKVSATNSPAVTKALEAEAKIRALLNPPTVGGPPIPPTAPATPEGTDKAQAPDLDFGAIEPQPDPNCGRQGRDAQAIGPQITFNEPVGDFLDKAIAWADSLPGAVDPAVLERQSMPAKDSVHVRIRDGLWFRIVDTGTGVIHWAALSGGERGMTMKETWDRVVDARAVAPLYTVEPQDRDLIRHTPTGVHPGTCKGCNVDPRTWGTRVKALECPPGQHDPSADGSRCIACGVMLTNPETQGDPTRAEYKRLEAQALEYLEHGCDGPVTRFVVISRAIALARSGKYPPAGPHADDPIGNALFHALFGLEGEDRTLIEGNGS